MESTGRSPALRYGVAVLSVAGVTLIRGLLQSVLGGPTPSLPFEVAVMISAWYGGLRPGLLATALAAFTSGTLFLLPSDNPLSIARPGGAVDLALFPAIGVVISILIDTLKSEVVERRLAEQASKAQAETLLRTIEQLTQEHRLEEFPGIVLASIVEQLDASGGSLWVYDEATETSERVLDYEGGRVARAGGLAEEHRPSKVDHRQSPGWDAMKPRFLRGESILVSDPEEDPFLDPETRAFLTTKSIRTLLVVPLLLQGRLTGYYRLRSTRRETYSARDLELARALAHQATLAMQLTGLAEQAREAAVLQERNRMAREIHDTLAQAFTGILLQLGAAERILPEAPERGQGHLQTARDLAREGLTEARRSVQALRPQALEATDLAGALARMTEQLSTDQATQIQFRMGGAPRPLPPEVAGHLLRIGQEALTNALRHAQASAVQVELTFGEQELRLRVSDDGCGFAVDPERTEGFGLTGLQERAAIIGAQLIVAGEPGSGTRVELTWPLPSG